MDYTRYKQANTLITKLVEDFFNFLPRSINGLTRLELSYILYSTWVDYNPTLSNCHLVNYSPPQNIYEKLISGPLLTQVLPSQKSQPTQQRAHSFSLTHLHTLPARQATFIAYFTQTPTASSSLLFLASWPPSHGCSCSSPMGYLNKGSYIST